MNTKIARREFFLSAGLGAVAVMAQAQRAGAKVMPKALVFDTFGTVVDWRSSIIEEGAAWDKEHRVTIDWAKFAERWRAGYGPAMNKVRKGEMPWTKLDVLHRMILEDVLREFGMNGLTEEQKDHWNKVWHRLKPWPDSVAGLTRLKKKFIIGPMSNGNIGLMTDMAKNAGLPWDVILGAELVRHYKPDKETYLSAADFLGLKVEETMMVAAHYGDLKAAQALGLQTGFVYRPNEYGAGGRADKANPGDFDYVARDFLDLASQLGA